MALKSSSQTLGEAFAGVGQAKKIAFDIETLQSAADIINTRLEQSQADYTKKKQKRTTGGYYMVYAVLEDKDGKPVKKEKKKGNKKIK